MSRTVRAALIGLTAAAVSAALGWGFTVDDALVSTRVAHHLAQGLGYRFNPRGAIVDCVTPLGWAPLLAPLSGGGAREGLVAASGLGLGAWLLGVAFLGQRAARESSGSGYLDLALAIAVNLPLGAWAGAGMETGVVMALGCVALTPTPVGAACAGLAGALRPELVPWAACLAWSSAWAQGQPLSRRALWLALALAPALVVAFTRELVFGHPTPLATFAKPSDASHGLRYALGALLLSGPPFLLLARPSQLGHLPRLQRARLGAAGAHLWVLFGVGGDWMPLFRLFLPVLPSVLLPAAALASSSGPRARALRLALLAASAGLLHAGRGAAARAVKHDRARMMTELAPLLESARHVAALDVGWVGAAGDYEVVDLAGITDPSVAYLPGGHTTKRLPDDFLERRGVDAMVLLEEMPPRTPPDYSRGVERRASGLRGADRFATVGRIRLSETQSYRVLQRLSAEDRRSP